MRQDETSKACCGSCAGEGWASLRTFGASLARPGMSQENCDNWALLPCVIAALASHRPITRRGPCCMYCAVLSVDLASVFIPPAVLFFHPDGREVHPSTRPNPAQPNQPLDPPPRDSSSRKLPKLGLFHSRVLAGGLMVGTPRDRPKPQEHKNNSNPIHTTADSIVEPPVTKASANAHTRRLARFNNTNNKDNSNPRAATAADSI